MIKRDYVPFIWSTAIFAASFCLMLLAIAREEIFIASSQITVPSISGAADGIPGGAGLSNIEEAITINSTGFPVLYFLGAAAILGVFLYFIPVSRLWFLLRVLFGFGFAWGVFIFAGFFLPPVPAIVIALFCALTWFIIPKIWLHNILLILTLVSLSAVFSAMFSPWTVILIIMIIAVYDFLAVRFGYMQWMARKLSDAETLPAFFIPYQLRNLNMSLKGSFVKDLFEDRGERQFSILGGGDIFFPLWLSGTVWFAANTEKTLIVGAFSLMGIAATYFIHYHWMKGKATPALPAIFITSLIGLLLVSFIQAG